jgi:hypothetical protein
VRKALTISPADQIANELMTRALHSNADITFDHTPSSHLDDTDALLAIRRQNTSTKAPRERKKPGALRMKPPPTPMDINRGMNSGEEIEPVRTFESDSDDYEDDMDTSSE